MMLQKQNRLFLVSFFYQFIDFVLSFTFFNTLCKIKTIFDQTIVNYRRTKPSNGGKNYHVSWCNWFGEKYIG